MAGNTASSPTTDSQIRDALKNVLRAEDSSAALFDELPLCRGKSRADIAAVNGHLCGFEIKSANDGLGRLAGQIENYDRIFDKSLAVITDGHLKAVRRAVPSRWGLMLARIHDGQTLIECVRKPRFHGGTEPRDVLRLLWRQEAIQLLRARDIRIRSDALVSEVWEAALTLPPPTLKAGVRAALKARRGTGSAAS